jgi:hypothetical protein
MGFWSNLFGGGNSNAPKGAFFLEDETAKSMGDTSYMRETKTVRRTFPGAAGKEEFEQVNRVSAEARRLADSRGTVSTNEAPKITKADVSGSYQAPQSYQAPSYQASYQAPKAQAPAPAKEEFKPMEEPTLQPKTPARRPSGSDSGMDMFRNMAKNIKK